MKYQLRSCVWEITAACCLQCRYCGSEAGKARAGELSTEECKEVVRQLTEIGCKRVSLIGGEVFMRSDWNIIVRELTDKNMKTSIITNGFMVSETLIQELKSLCIESVAVSLDGLENVHDKFRQKGSFSRAEKTVERLTDSGIPVSIISTLNCENVNMLEEFYQYICKWPIYAWQLQACSPMGNTVKSGIDYAFDHNIVIDFVISHLFEVPFLLGIADNIGYFSVAEGYLRGNKSGLAVFRGCQAGLSSLGIDSIGNVRGCESMYDDYFIEGNLREKSLQEIWESPDTFLYNREFREDQLSGQCGICPHGKLCAGGCRSYNYFVHKKLYESPCCVRTKIRGK